MRATSVALAAVLLGCSSSESEPAPEGPGTDASTTEVLGSESTADEGTPDGAGGEASVDSSVLDSATTSEASSETAPLDAPSDAGGWTVPVAHPRIYLNAKQKARLLGLVAANHPAATAFLAVQTTAYDYKAWFSALKFHLTGTASHCTTAVSRIESEVAAEEALISSNQRATVAADSYLYVGDRIGDLALTLDWCWDQTTVAQRTRWLAYANQAVWNVWNHTAAKWGTTTYAWSGWSVTNPSNNYYYSFLRATMLLGLVEYTESPDGPKWVKQFRETKLQAELVPRFTQELEGGGSREGTGYGVAMKELFRLYDLWEQSTGERIADLTGHARASLAFMLHEIVPTLTHVVPVGDHARDSTGALFDYHRDYANVLTWLYPSDPLAARLRHVLDASSVPKMTQGFMRYSDLLYANPSLAAVAPTDVYPAYHAKGTGNLFVRSAFAADATFLHFMCGPYTESHAHQDQGSFLLYKRGWLGYDANFDSTSGIEQATTFHSLVRVTSGTTPVGQVEGTTSTLLALQDAPEWTYVAADLTPAYKGKTAIGKMQRELVLLKPNVLVVFDRVTTSGTVTRTWQLQTPKRPTISGRRATITEAGTTMTIDAVLPTTSTLSTFDWSTTSGVSSGFRFEATQATGDTTIFLHVLSLDGAATAVVVDDVTGQRGVKVTLAGGATAVVRFSEATAGGTLELKRADASVITTGARPMTIQTLPAMK